MTLREPFPYCCLSLSLTGLSLTAAFKINRNNYSLNLDTNFHYLIHEPEVIYVVQMYFDTGITTRCILLVHST